MFETLRKLIHPPPAAPCSHPKLVFDWYRDSGIATCTGCAEVFLVGLDQAPAPDWAPIPRNGGFDGL